MHSSMAQYMLNRPELLHVHNSMKKDSDKEINNFLSENKHAIQVFQMHVMVIKALHS